jgi:hypothetical protein
LGARETPQEREARDDDLALWAPRGPSPMWLPPATWGYGARVMRIGLLGLIYIFIGVFVAASHDYLERLGSVRGIVTGLLGILLWPLLLIGVDVRVT